MVFQTLNGMNAYSTENKGGDAFATSGKPGNKVFKENCIKNGFFLNPRWQRADMAADSLRISDLLTLNNSYNHRTVFQLQGNWWEFSDSDFVSTSQFRCR